MESQGQEGGEDHEQASERARGAGDSATFSHSSGVAGKVRRDCSAEVAERRL